MRQVTWLGSSIPRFILRSIRLASLLFLVVYPSSLYDLVHNYVTRTTCLTSITLIPVANLDDLFDNHNMARIRDVWAPNLEIEMRNIREAIDKYSYVSMVVSFYLVTMPKLTLSLIRTPSFLEWWRAR